MGRQGLALGTYSSNADPAPLPPLSGWQVGGVNCLTDNSLCSAHKVTGLPTVKLFVEGQAVDYTGNVDLKGLHDFVTQEMPAPIANVRRPQQVSERAS